MEPDGGMRADAESPSHGTSGEAPSKKQQYPEQRLNFARLRARPPRPRRKEGVWRLALRRVWYRLQNDPLDILAGGVALFGVLSLMPGLAALISIYGLIASPADIEAQVAPLARVVPPEVVSLVTSQLEAAATESAPALGLATAGSLLLALFSATGGLRALMSALNLAHNHPEKRSWLKRTLIAMALGVGGLFTVIVAVGLVVLLPTLLRVVRLDAHTEGLVNVLRWPVLFTLVMGAIAVLYRVGPVDPTRRIAAGAGVATLLWLIASVALSAYVVRVANYSGLYGAFGGALVVILWFYVSAFIILLGAVLNEELAEARWRRSSARARPRPRPAPRSRAA
jgi:membrane protein